MTGTELRNILNDIPPGPFTVHVAEKTPIEVLHTDYAMTSPNRETLIVYNTKGGMNYIDVAEITRISRGKPKGRPGRRTAR